jgi:superfamily II DNA or RNA helicase
VTIISYDLVAKFFQEIEDQHFGVLVADEAHFVKTLSAQVLLLLRDYSQA